MFIIIVLRLFLVLKWILQFFGILAPLFVFWEPQNKGLIAVISTTLIIIPEVVMAAVLWIGKGVSSVYKMKNPEHACINVPVFDEHSIQVSFFGYTLILVSLSILIGSFLEIPVLAAGITALVCFAWRKNLKVLFMKYLEINA